MNWKKLLCLAVIAASLMSACTSPATADPPSPDATGETARYSVIFTEPQSGYTLITSDLLDTLFIAGALYYDFASSNLCPADFPLGYEDVQAHFTPYQTHPFIATLATYTDDSRQDINGDVVRPLIYYLLTGEGFSHWQSSTFADAAEVNTFIEELTQFYHDTGAREFFARNARREDMLAYLPAAAEELPIAEYYRELEAYVGNTEARFSDCNRHYYNLITPFRPYLASFYDCALDQDRYLVAQLAPYSVGYGSLDIRQIVETSLHETLHLSINEAVADQRELIETLTQNRKPADYTSPLYVNLPWPRITDEALVRAVQAGIYRQVYDDSAQAYEELLVKEINAGIANLDHLYEVLLTYENGRDQYPAIDTFIEILICEYFAAEDN